MIDLFNHAMVGLACGLAPVTCWCSFAAWRNTSKLLAIYTAQRAGLNSLAAMAAAPRSFSPTQHN